MFSTLFLPLLSVCACLTIDSIWPVTLRTDTQQMVSILTTKTTVCEIKIQISKKDIKGVRKGGARSCLFLCTECSKNLNTNIISPHSLYFPSLINKHRYRDRHRNTNIPVSDCQNAAFYVLLFSSIHVTLSSLLINPEYCVYIVFIPFSHSGSEHRLQRHVGQHRLEMGISASLDESTDKQQER